MPTRQSVPADLICTCGQDELEPSLHGVGETLDLTAYYYCCGVCGQTGAEYVNENDNHRELGGCLEYR